MSWVMAASVAALAAAATTVWMQRRMRSAPLAEALFRVTADETGITSIAANGERTALAWPDIARVTIRTTDEGPFATDVFWEFDTASRQNALWVPGGATGEGELLQALGERLPGFRHEEVIRAMGSTSKATFVVWEAGP